MAFLRKRAGFKKTSHIVKPEYKHQTYSVSSKGHTVFRIFPAPKEGGGFDEQIVPVDGEPVEGLGNSFAEVEIVDWFGKDKLSFITTCLDVDGEENLSPCLLFYNIIGDFCKDEGKKAIAGQPFAPALSVWSPWFAEKKGIAALPQTRMLLQGVLIEHAGEPCKNKDGVIVPRVPIVLCLGRSATIDLEDKLTIKVDPVKDISAENSRIGDITGIETGRAIRCYSYKNKEKQTRYTIEPNFQVEADGKTHTPLAPIVLDPKMVMSHFVPWEQLLNIQNADWQIEKIIEQFGPEAADFAFREDVLYGPMLPPEVAGSYERTFGDAQTTQAVATKPPQQTTAPAPAANPTNAAGATQMMGSPVASAAPQTAAPQPTVLEAEVVEEPPDDIPHMGDAPAESKPAATPANDATNSAVAIAMAAAKENQTPK